jgi:hypothetical protein
MAVKRIEDIVELVGLSTDTKPTDCPSGSTFYELDTGKGFIYNSVNVNPVTGNGWWGV